MDDWKRGKHINWFPKINQYICLHNPNHTQINTGVPACFETTYCKDCILEWYDQAPACPICGVKEGFEMGTGDCVCLG